MSPDTTPARGKGDSDATHNNETQVKDANERWQRTATAAFYRAEARGFLPGSELEDWLAAEKELSQTRPTASAAAAPSPEPENVPELGSAARRRPAGKGGSRARKTGRSGRDIGGMT
jgi:hypothetical protein